MSACNKRNDPIAIDVRTYTAIYQNNVVLVPLLGVSAHLIKQIKRCLTAHFGSDSTITDVQEKTNVVILTRSAATLLHDSYQVHISQEGGLHVDKNCWTLDKPMVPCPLAVFAWMTNPVKSYRR